MQAMCGMTNKSEFHYSIPAHATDGERCPFCQNKGGMELKSSTWQDFFTSNAKMTRSDFDCRHCYRRSYRWYD